MRFFMYTLGDESDPRLTAPPTPQVMTEMGAFMAEALGAGESRIRRVFGAEDGPPR